MAAGKILSIIAGILTLLSTFLLVIFTAGAGGVHGVGLAIVMVNMFSHAADYVVPIGVPIYVVYIIAVGIIFFLLAGIFQLIGAKVRALGIIGSLFPLALGIVVMLATFNVIPGIMGNLAFMGHPLEFVAGILPYNLDNLVPNIAMGTYPLLLGGLLGLIAGFMKRD